MTVVDVQMTFSFDFSSVFSSLYQSEVKVSHQNSIQPTLSVYFVRFQFDFFLFPVHKLNLHTKQMSNKSGYHQLVLSDWRARKKKHSIGSHMILCLTNALTNFLLPSNKQPFFFLFKRTNGVCQILHIHTYIVQHNYYATMNDFSTNYMSKFKGAAIWQLTHLFAVSIWSHWKRFNIQTKKYGFIVYYVLLVCRMSGKCVSYIYSQRT